MISFEKTYPGDGDGDDTKSLHQVTWSATPEHLFLKNS